MSVYTAVNAKDLKKLLKHYNLGTLIDHQGIVAGTVNSNFTVQTSHGHSVLTLFETLSPKALLTILPFLSYLAEHQIPCPYPIADNSGQLVQVLHEKPAVLVPLLPGQTYSTVTIAQCQAIAKALAQMHQLSQSYPKLINNPFGPAWQKTAINRVTSFLTQAQSALLEQELSHQAQQRYDLPCGIIHADIFKDNVLFVGETLSGIIDFYFACSDFLLKDVAVLINDWCFNESGQFLPTHYHAIMQSYQSVRVFEPNEQAALPSLCRASALRFWLSRLEAQWTRPASEKVLIKDPSFCEQQLRFYSTSSLA